MESSDSAAILAALKTLSQELAAFRGEVRVRFDQVDARLDGLHRGVMWLGEQEHDPRFPTPEGEERTEALREVMRPRSNRTKVPAE